MPCLFSEACMRKKLLASTSVREYDAACQPAAAHAHDNSSQVVWVLYVIVFSCAEQGFPPGVMPVAGPILTECFCCGRLETSRIQQYYTSAEYCQQSTADRAVSTCNKPFLEKYWKLCQRSCWICQCLECWPGYRVGIVTEFWCSTRLAVTRIGLGLVWPLLKADRMIGCNCGA